MAKLINLVGRKFGMLTVTARGKQGINKHIYWVCECECEGKTVREVSGCHLKSGDVRSCGCASDEFRSTAMTRHGQKKRSGYTSEYTAWCSITDRCYNPKNKAYENYGGRGITVCDRWRDSFETFYADMGPKPSPQHSIDRHPNNDGNYEPGNTRWATGTEQGRNKRTNRLITFRGETKTMVDWAEALGIGYQTLAQRLNRLRWSVERAFTAPTTKGPKRKPQSAT